MTGCNTGRNIQKYKGAGASTLQDALENGNTASLDVVLQSPAVFIGDGGGLSNINASSTTGNLQAVTNNGATSTTKITLTNSATSLETTGNIVVSTNVYATEFYGDGGTLSNIAANKNFQDVTTLGNTSSLTISFTNPAESITTTGNVIVGTNVHATEFVGDGSSLTSLNADNIDSGELAITRGGTGVTTGLNVLDPSKLNTAVSISKGGTGQASASAAATALGLGTGNSPQFTGISLGSTAITESSGTVSIGGSVIRTGDISLGTDTTGNYVKTVTAGNGLDITGSTGEGSDHMLSLDLKANHGLAIDNTELKIDLKASGGLEFDSSDSYKMRVKLDDANTSGKLPVNKGGTANDTFTGGGVLYYDSSNTKFVSTGSGNNGDVLKINNSGVPDWGSDNVGGGGGGGSVTINTSIASAENDLIFTTGSNSLDKDDNGRIKYNPGTNILTIKDSQSRSNTLNSLSWSGNAASADKLSTTRKIGNVDFNGTADIIPNAIQLSDSNDDTNFLVPFSNVTSNGTIKLNSDAGVLTYNPDSGTLNSANFVGNGSGLEDINAGELSSGVIHKNRYTTSNPNHNSIFFYDTSINELNTVPPNTSGTKYLKSVGPNGDLSWDTVTATISIADDNTSDELDLVFTKNGSDLKRDSDNKIKYIPNTNTLKIIDTSSRSNTLTSLSWSGNADSADKLSTARKIGNVDFNGTSDISLVSEENNTDTHRGIIFADGTNNNDLKHDNTEFKYNSAKGLLSVSNINATNTSTDARNSIANASLDHTLRVGTKIICEEEKNSTHGNDALRVNGNVVVVDYILGNGRYLQGINIQQDSNGSDTFVTNDGAPSQSSRLARFNA